MSKSNPLFWWQQPPVVVRYGVAVLSVAAALIIVRWPLLHLQAAPVSLFLCAVMFSAWFGGARPGLLTAALSVLAFYYYFLAPTQLLVVKTGEMPRLVIFTLSVVFVGSLSAAQRSAAESLWQARADLDRTVQELRRINEALQAEIATRQRAEDALRRSEDRLRQIIDAIPTMAWSVRPDGAVDFLNQRWLDYTGLSLAEGLEEPTRVVHPEDLASVMEQWLADRTAGRPSEAEMRLRRADGEYRWFLVRSVPLRDERGNIVKWYGSSIDIEDRKLAECALRESEERFRRLVELMPVAVYVCDASGIIQIYNHRAAELWGREPQSGGTAQRYCGSLRLYSSDGKFVPHQESPMVEVLRTGIEARNVEMVIERPDGSRITVAAQIAPLKNADGELTGAVNCLQDITERKRAEGDLRKQKEILQKIFDNVPAMIRFVGPDGKTKLVNREWERTIGWTLEEILRQDLDVFAELYPDPKYRQAVMKFVFTPNAEFAHFRTRVRDGRVIDTSWGMVRLSDGTTIGIGRDITERKRAEEALRRSEAYLAAAQSLSHTGSWALNVSSGELFWSQETYRIFGFDPAETNASINGTFLARIHPEDRPKIEGGLKAATVQKGSYAADYRIVLPDGSIKHIHDVVYPVTNEAGDVVERYGVIMDVTERKRTEEELERSRDQLRALAGRLQKVREEERTRVAREIHDELGQALTAIKIDFSSLCRALPADKKQESESILKLVDETLQSVRRISTELRPPILDAVGLMAAVEWAGEEFAARTGTKCRLDLPQEDLVIDQEPATALFRIFQETLTNVARHAGATEVSVRLAKDDGNLTLEVHDNGQGVSREELSAGSSLGILGMRERALLLGGELTITGAPGEGTTVRVRVPVTHPPAPKDGK